MQIHRQRWDLSQREMGLLLGKAASTVSRYEHGMVPPVKVAIAYDVIFGIGLKRKAFPMLYAEVEEEVIKRGVELWSELEGDESPKAERKRELLLQIISRVPGELQAA